MGTDRPKAPDAPSVWFSDNRTRFTGKVRYRVVGDADRSGVVVVEYETPWGAQEEVRLRGLVAFLLDTVAGVGDGEKPDAPATTDGLLDELNDEISATEAWLSSLGVRARCFVRTGEGFDEVGFGKYDGQYRLLYKPAQSAREVPLVSVSAETRVAAVGTLKNLVDNLLKANDVMSRTIRTTSAELRALRESRR